MAGTTEQVLACLEVWGGNTAVDAAVVLPGMNAWVYAVPDGNAEAGGDVHFVSSCGSGRISRMMIADVAGHGIEVAGVARSLRDLMRRFMNQIDQRRLLGQMNEKFTELSDAGRFATAFIATYFAPTRKLAVCNAGHPPPLLYREKSRQWTYLDSQTMTDDVANIPLGILADAGYEQFEVQLDVGDLLVGYTDSLIEARDSNGELLGATRLIELVRLLPLDRVEQLIPNLMRRLADEGVTLNDDLTVLVCAANGARTSHGFFGRLAGGLRFVRSLTGLGGPVPWPEWTLKNVGGYLLPGLSRRK
jgi:phosphoserine phosphatase RsbU/P